MLVSILSTISNLTQLISCQYIFREVVVRQGGLVASLHSLPHLSNPPRLVSSPAPPISLSVPPLEVRRALLLLACYYQGLTTIPLKLLPCKKEHRLFPRLLIPTHHYLLKPPSLLYTQAIYDALIVQKNHNPAHSAQALWAVNHLITSVKLLSEGLSVGAPSRNRCPVLSWLLSGDL